MTKLLLGACALVLLAAGPAAAETVEVKMLNKGANGEMMVFEPAVVQIAPGDTVRFLATNPGHNAESVPGMLPDGAKGFRTTFNQTAEVTFETEGVYGYKCLPHYAMGMVGLVRVGAGDANLDALAEKADGAPGRAAQRFQAHISGLK